MSASAPWRTRTVGTQLSTPPSLTTGERMSTPAAWPVRDEIITLANIALESGESITSLDVHVRVEGAIASTRDNVVLIAHALTGTVRATEWWKGVVGVGAAIDPTRHAVLTANLIGGCDGTVTQDAAPLPAITTRDQASVLARVLDALQIHAPLLVCGGSLGGQVTLEFAASFPERIREAVVLAAPAVQTAQGLAWNAIMRQALLIGGARDGLALARMVGMLSYRTPAGLEHRFGRQQDGDGNFRVNSWLHAHGDKLVERFDATSYRALIDAMDTHDIGRARGGIAAALSTVASRLTGVGIAGDLLYPAESVMEWTSASHARYESITSPHGHDAFLLETTQVNAILKRALDRSSATVGVTAVAKAPLRIALAGCGHVGGNVLELLEAAAATNDARAVPVVVERVLVRDARRTRPALEHAIANNIARVDACVSDPARLLDRPVDVLIEAIGGTTTARTIVEAALRRSIRVVTANKALLAECGPYLSKLAETHGTRIDFEASVAGAIPIVRCIRNGAAGVGITGITGILNGTSNFVLDCLATGTSLPDAIAIAQQRGYAEADPTRDLSGEDAEDKLRVLAWLAFGIDPASLRVVRRGIDAETAAWAARVAAEGDRVKLIASCIIHEGELVARIIPTRVVREDAWAVVSGPSNRIVIESESAGSIVFQGVGAGGRATAGAVLSDVLGLLPPRWSARPHP